jgi:hypothetical protein
VRFEGKVRRRRRTWRHQQRQTGAGRGGDRMRVAAQQGDELGMSSDHRGESVLALLLDDVDLRAAEFDRRMVTPPPG